MKRLDYRISLIYLLVGVVWILFSDKILLSFEKDPEILSRIQSYKGWFFVLASSLLIFILSRRYIKKLLKLNSVQIEHIKELENARNKVELSTRTSKIGFWEWNIKTNEVYFSHEWKRQIGYKEDEISNKLEEWEERLHPDDLVIVNKRLKEFISGETSEFRAEFRFKHKDGYYIWILASAAVFKNKNNEVEVLLGTHMDINDRKLAEKSLEDNQRKINTLIGNLNGIVYQCKYDEQWTMLFLSKGIKPITGYTAGELINNKALAYENIILLEDRERVRNVIEKTLNKDEKFQINYRIKTKFGEVKWVWEQGRIINKEGENFIEGYITDITPQKRAEEALIESERKYKDLVENALIGIYTTNLDGDFLYGNNALALILGYTSFEKLRQINVWSVYKKNKLREDFINLIKKLKDLTNY